MDYCDLHLHTTCSHGRFSPSRVVELAAQRGLRAIAITDHNNGAGIAEAMAAGREYGVEVIGGCEFSADWRNAELHVHGLFLDPAHPAFREVMREADRLWRERLWRMMKLVEKETGIELSWDDIYYTGYNSQVSPVAEAIGKKLGMSTHDAFHRFIWEGCSCFVPPLVDVAWVAEQAHRLGGVCVMAHAWAYGEEWPQPEEDFAKLAAAGVDGIECYHPAHAPEDLERHIAQTRAAGLAVSGGSDCHGAGPGQDFRMGTLHVPYSVVEELQARRR